MSIHQWTRHRFKVQHWIQLIANKRKQIEVRSYRFRVVNHCDSILSSFGLCLWKMISFIRFCVFIWSEIQMRPITVTIQLIFEVYAFIARCLNLLFKIYLIVSLKFFRFAHQIIFQFLNHRDYSIRNILNE